MPEMGFDIGLIDLVEPDFSFLNFFGDGLGSPHNFVAASVIETDVEDLALVILGVLNGLETGIPRRLGKTAKVTRNDDFATPSRETWNLPSEEFLQIPHEVIDLVLGTGPILGGEGIDRDDLDSLTVAFVDDFP